MCETVVGAYLTLIGDVFDVSYVSNTLGILPNYTRNKDEILRNGMKFGHTEWGIETACVKSFDINDQINELLSVFADKKDLMKQLCIDCDAQWHLLILIKIENGEVPATYFTNEILQFAVAINAEIGLDIYVLSERKDM